MYLSLLSALSLLGFFGWCVQHVRFDHDLVVGGLRLRVVVSLSLSDSSVCCLGNSANMGRIFDSKAPQLLRETASTKLVESSQVYHTTNV